MPQTRSKRAHVRRPARELCLRSQKLVIPSLRAGRAPPFPAAPDRPQAYGRSEVTEGRGRRGETESITCSSCGIVRNGGEPTEHRAGRNLIWRRKADFARPHGAAHVANLHGQARPCSVMCGDHGPGWMTTEFRMQLPRDLHETGFSCPEYRSGPGACRRTGCVVG